MYNIRREDYPSSAKTNSDDMKTNLPIDRNQFGDEDWNNLELLSEKFGIKWGMKVLDSTTDKTIHPLFDFYVIGNLIGHAVYYEVWMTETRMGPSRAIGFQGIKYWHRIPIRDALEMKCENWRNFMKKALLKGAPLDMLTAVDVQQELLEKI